MSCAKNCSATFAFGKCSQDKHRKLKMPLAFLALSGAIPSSSKKIPHLAMRHFLWWRWWVLHPRPIGNLVAYYVCSLFNFVSLP